MTKMSTLGRLRIPSLLKLALVVITLSGLSLFFVVHRIEKPFIQDLRSQINDGYRFTEDNNNGFVQRIGERQDNVLQDDDDFFQRLIDNPSNSSEKNVTTSEAPYRHKSKFLPTRRGSSESKSSYHGNKKNSQSGRRLDDQNLNISLSDFQQPLPNYHRNFSDDKRRLPDVQSNSQRRPESMEPSLQLNERTDKMKESIDSKIKRSEEVESKAQNHEKMNVQESKPFESNSENQRRNSTKNPYLPERRSDNAAKATNPISNSNKLKENPVMNKARPRAQSSYDVQVRNPGSNATSVNTKDERLNLYSNTDRRLKEYSSNPERNSHDLRDSEQLPKESSKELKPFVQQNSSKMISKNRGDSQPRISNFVRNSDQPRKEISEKVKASLQPHSSKRAGFHYQGKTVSKATNEHLNSDQLQKPSSKRIKSRGEQQSSKVSSNYQRTSKEKGTHLIRNYDQFPKASPKKRKSLLIFGDDRSGTTFVTKMFAADPQMFTVYEPLWVTNRWFKDIGTEDLGYQKRIVLDVVNGLLSCKFTRSAAARTFLSYTRTSWVGQSVFPNNVFRTKPFKNKTKSGLLYYPNLSRHPKFAEDACLKSFNHSVVKVGQVRVPQDDISVFIPRVFEENPDTDIRVIQIVRDPRGSINSRIRRGWISDFTYTGFPGTVASMCRKITENIKFGRNLQHELLKERYMEITYKEITTMPVTTAKKIYKFAGFEMPDELVDWIASSTNPDEEQLAEAILDPFSHVRDSSNNYFKWRKESPIKRIRVIEKLCKELLDLLRLDPVADEMETICFG